MAGELQGRRLEPVAAGIERRGGQRRQRAHQPVHRVVGALRIGDVALRAVHGDLGVQAAAPADLDHVAEPAPGRSARRPGRNPGSGRAPPSSPARARCRRPPSAFLVAGDQQADRAARGRAPAARCCAHGGDEGGDARPSCRRRRGRTARRRAPRRRTDRRRQAPSPGGTTSVWPAKQKCGAAGAEAGEQVLDRAVAQPRDGEAEPLQRRGQHVLRPGIRRGDRRSSGSAPGRAAAGRPAVDASVNRAAVR